MVSEIQQTIDRLIRNKDGDESRTCAILSDLDHTLTKLNYPKRLALMPIEKPENFDEMALDDKAYMASLIELVYNKNSKKPPSWVLSEEYKLEKPEDSKVYARMRRLYKTEERIARMLTMALEDTIPEFRKRNLIQDGIFDSF